MDYYNTLGIDKNATKEEIKKAYRKLAMQYHPDRNNGDKEAEKSFKEVNEAYSILSDDNKRKQYDMFGKVGGDSGFSSSGFNVDFDLGDIFEGFFGGSNSGRRKKQSRERKGEDIEKLINIDLKTSIYGGKIKINFDKLVTCESCKGEGGSGKKTCSKCNGTGYITYTQQSLFGVISQTGECDQCHGRGEVFEEVCSKCSGEGRHHSKKELELDIPAGIDNAMIIKLTGEGNDGIKTKASGDLYLKFSVSLEEKGLTRKGQDLYYDLEIDVLEAILGTKKEINIPVIGKRQIEIKAGTQHGAVIKISGDGVKNINSDKKGDLYIKLFLKIPKKLSKFERERYEEIAREKKINVNDKKGIFGNLFE